MYTALQATSITLVNLLQRNIASDQLLVPHFVPAGTRVISLNNPQEMSENRFDGISVWLYRIVRDAQRLNAPPERVAHNRIRRKPLPFCLYYLMTPIISNRTPQSPETEQLLMGKVLQVFHDHPLIYGSSLGAGFEGTDVELRVRLDPIGLEEITRIWDSLDRSYQLSVSYEVSVVYIESELPEEIVHPVDVALPQYGVIVSSEKL